MKYNLRRLHRLPTRRPLEIFFMIPSYFKIEILSNVVNKPRYTEKVYVGSSFFWPILVPLVR